MISTVAQVKTRVLDLLDDSAGAVFTDAILTPGFNEAYDALKSAFLQYQLPYNEQIVNYTLPANTTSLTPATAGIVDMGELIELEERAYGSSDRFNQVWERDKLTQRDALSILGEFVWRRDAFYFNGATDARELRITYRESSTPPTASVGIDGAITFLSTYTAGRIGPRKGYVVDGQEYMLQAVGPRYFTEAVIGGELWRLIQPMIRSMQRVQIAPKPYSVVRRRWRRQMGPFVVSAGAQSGGGQVPVDFSYAAGTVTGTLDGVNATFYLAYPVSKVEVVLNGATLTPTTQYTHVTNVVTFIAPYVPHPGASILVQAWV